MSYAPDESTADILAEKGWLRGAIVASVAYGVDFTFFALCFCLLVCQIKRCRKTGAYIRMKCTLLIYISVLFILATLFMGSLAKSTELAFIDNRNYHGGPNAYERGTFSIPVDEMGSASFVIANWLADVIVVWRFVVVYKGYNRLIVLLSYLLLPCLLFLSCIVTGILFLLQLSTSSPFGDLGHINYTIPFMSLSLALNVVVTLAIVARICYFQRQIISVLGSAYGAHYTDILAMIIESASIYTFYSLTFLILFGLENPLSTVFLQSLNPVQIATTFLIIFRVAQGKGWTVDIATQTLLTNKSLPSEHDPTQTPRLTRLMFPTVIEPAKSYGATESEFIAKMKESELSPV